MCRKWFQLPKPPGAPLQEQSSTVIRFSVSLTITLFYNTASMLMLKLVRSLLRNKHIQFSNAMSNLKKISRIVLLQTNPNIAFLNLTKCIAVIEMNNCTVQCF